MTESNTDTKFYSKLKSKMKTITDNKKIIKTSRLHTRLYLPRKEGRRRLNGIEDCVKRESKSLQACLRAGAQIQCFKWPRRKRFMLVEEENRLDYQRRRKETKVGKWKKKAPQEEFVQQTYADEAGEESWKLV